MRRTWAGIAKYKLEKGDKILALSSTLGPKLHIKLDRSMRIILLEVTRQREREIKQIATFKFNNVHLI
jgi:hypothetical protein